MDSAELMEKTKKAIRALLISAPRGVPARLFLVDYRKVMGKELPFRNLGFRNVDDFIRGIPDVLRIGMGATGEPTLFPVVTAQTSQIARFVATQKKPKLKRSYMPPSTMAPSRSVKMSGFSNKSSSYGRSRTRSNTRSFHQPRYLLNPPVQPYLSRGYTQPPPQHRGRLGSTPGPSYNSAAVPRSDSRSLIGNHVYAYAPPTHRGRISSTPSYTSAVNETTVGLGSISIEPRSPVGGPMWKDEYSRAKYLSVNDMRVVQRTLAYDLLRTEGYVCTPYRIDKVGDGIKYLLYSDLSSSETPSDGRGVFPAVMLYFRANIWNKREHPELATIKPATKLLVYGKPFKQISAKNGREEPAMMVVYYEVVSALSKGGALSFPPLRSDNVPSSVQLSGQVRTTASVSSPTSSQWTSCPSIPPVGLVSSSLKQAILMTLEPHSEVRETQLETLFTEKTGKDPPNRFLEIAQSLPEVVCRRDAEGLVYSLKQSSQRPADSARPDTSPAGFVSGSLKQKIFKLLKEKPNGLYVRHLRMVFEDKYKSEAPMNLAEIIKSLDFIDYDGSSNPEHPMVYLKTDASTPTEPTPPASPLTLVLPSSVEFDIDTEIFDVTITFVNSVTSFYVQMIGSDYSDKFAEMMQKMNAYLGKHAQKLKHPVAVDDMYGFLWDDGGGDKLWCRAVVGSLSDNKAQVLFPDYGNGDLVDVHALRELPPPFYQLPFQAVQCCLHGLTDNDEINSQFNELISGASYTAQVMDRSGSRVSVELMDSDPAVHETINSILLRATHPILTLEPHLPELGEPMVPVKLTDIDLEGVIALQVQGPGLNQLQQLMAIINNVYLDKEAGPNDKVTEVKKGSLYCAQYDDKWYRVEVTKVISLKEVTVHYVDYGNEDDLLTNDLRAPVKDELFSLPFQAVKCTLAGLPPEGGKWTEAAINHVWDKEENLNVSVVQSESGGTLPSVTLTLCADGEELNLNHWLAEQPDLFFDREEPLESQLTELECVTSCPVSTSDGTLFSPHTPQSTPSPATPVTSPPPELSTMPCASLTLSELSQVMLSWTESPSNFVVQLSENLAPLESMMTSLNKALASSSALPSSLTTGQLCCATCSIDGRWYRAVIVGIDSAIATVEFVDFGGHEEVLCSSLRALPPHLSSYPMQGIKCTLYGIKPIEEQWSPEASRFFNDHAEKQYYVFCKQISDERSSILFFAEGDVQISQKMIDKGFASTTLK